MQRAVRYLRYNADSLGLGGMDCIAASGFSGGSGTILGEVANLYGNVQPTLYDADYASDAVDQMSADLDVVCPLYGPQYDGEHTSDYAGLVTENPNLPAMFLLWVKTTSPAPCPTFGLCQFGPGQDSGGSSHLCRGRPRLWRRPARHYFHLLDSHADTFIDLVMGRGEAGVGEAAEIPEGYTGAAVYL